MDTPQTRNRLLLVDGDPKSLRVLDVSLKKAGFDVITASTGQEALESLEAEIPDLIISDTDLNEMDGFELCNRIKAKPDWAKIPFLFVSGRKSIEDKIRGLELGVDDYLTKPIYIKEIGIRVRTALQRAERERMESRREGRTRFAGDLSDVGVVDLVQTIELNRKSGIIHIVNRDERRGSIFFREGKVIDAEVGRLSGANALYRLFSWSDGQFAVEFKNIRRHDVIDMSMAGLLMEGMRRLDEGTRLLGNLPSPTSVLEVDCRVLAEELAELPDEVNSVLRLCDGARTLQEVVEESDHPDLETIRIIDELSRDQIIFARERPERGGEPKPGVRLAHWLSEGDSEEAAAVRELRTSLQTDLPGTNTPGAEVLQAQAETPAPTRAEPLSAEDDLGALLPSRVEETIGESIDPGRAADTLKGIPVEDFFGERDEAETAVRAPAEIPAVATESPRQSPDEPRPTKPLALAERLLSGDSVVGAAAMHEAIAEGDGIIQEPLDPDRHTRPYGDPAGEAAAALVQEVVSSTHRSAKPGIPLAEPERPTKEVDWGAWPTTAAPEPTAKGMPVVPGLLRTAAAEPPATAPLDSKTSAAELDTSDLEEVESTDDAAGVPRAEAAADEGATRLGPEDVLPMETAADLPLRDDRESSSLGEPAKQAEQGADTTPQYGTVVIPVSPMVEEAAEGRPELAHSPLPGDSTITRAAKSPLPAGRLWLVGIAAFSLGLLGYLALGKWAPAPQEPTLVAGPPTPPTASAVAAAPVAPPVVVPAPVVSAPPSKAVGSPAVGLGVPPKTAPRLAAATRAAGVPAPSGAPRAKLGLVEDVPATVGSTAAELHDKCVAVDADGQGKASAVKAACRRALAADPKDAEVMVILARAEIDRGRLGEARSLARRALAADPSRVDAYVYLGTAEQEDGKVEEARAAYKKYLELAPEGRYAREMRAVLNNL